ncbi:hypothetical protein A1L58_07295 [Shewanella baltica]|uniref:hypothetical protein n=1 Tax=Shewanella baltica TaxID=62322 RepID=UPI0007B46C5B|nr:hypothetical protein [Shewanella baltica]KZK65353.1 hypothetical protein A1L58_07295 [Shewanella baltica]
MGSMLNVLPQLTFTLGDWVLHKDIRMSGIEKRRRLHWRETDMQNREIIGRWLDGRPLLGDKITLYKEDEKYFLETWFSDGCHSLDEVYMSQTAEGHKLEDVGGNFFGEFFIVTQSQQLQFCNEQGCYFKADKLAADADFAQGMRVA